MFNLIKKFFGIKTSPVSAEQPQVSRVESQITDSVTSTPVVDTKIEETKPKKTRKPREPKLPKATTLKKPRKPKA